MGYKLITQTVLIAASLVIIFAFIQPWLGEIKGKQDQLLEINETLARASQFNARLRELISIRDSFAQSDIDALEKFVPTSIDQLRTMSEIAGIFTLRGIAVKSMTAEEMVNPAQGDVEFESGIVPETSANADLSYQDYSVVFDGTYEQMRDVLLLTEASDSLLEIVDLHFNTTVKKEIDENGEITVPTGENEFTFTIVFRTYGLPIETSI
jgi:hypothetical protein